MEVILAQVGRVVSGGEHVAGGHWGREVVARLFIHVEIVLVQGLHGENINQVLVLTK